MVKSLTAIPVFLVLPLLGLSDVHSVPVCLVMGSASAESPEEYVEDMSLTEAWDLRSVKALRAKEAYDEARRKSRAAHESRVRQAKWRYEAEMKGLAETRKKEIAYLHKALRVSLEDAMKEAAKEGDTQEVARIRSAISNFEASALKAGTDAKPSGKPEDETAAGPAQPEGSPPLSATARLIVQIMKSLPTDLRPDPKTGWDKWTSPKVDEWLKRRRGIAFEAEGTFMQTRSNYRSGNQWTLYIMWKARTESVALDGYSLAVSFTNRRQGSSAFSYPTGSEVDTSWTEGVMVDESVAKRWAAVKEGTRLTVKGKVDGITVGSDGKSLRIYLANVSLDVLRERPKVVAKPPAAAPKTVTTTGPARVNPAASKLSLAKSYLKSGKSGMDSRGVALLHEIIQEYPNSKEAEEAGKLLEKPDSP